MSLAGSIPIDSIFAQTLSVFCILISITTAFGPLPTIIKIYKTKTTDEFPALPYFLMVLAATIWIFYGLLVEDVIVTLANVILLLPAIGYLITFIYFSKREIRRNIIKLLILLFISIAIGFIGFKNKLIFEIGLSAVLLFLIFQISPLIIILKVIKTKSCEFLPFELPCSLFFNGLLYTLYGYLVLDIFSVWLTAFITMLISSLQLICHCIYGDFLGNLRNLCCFCLTLTNKPVDDNDKSKLEEVEQATPVVLHTNTITLA